MVSELKSLIAQLSKQQADLVSSRNEANASSNVEGLYNSPWGNNAKLEFPSFNGEVVDRWLLRCEYYFGVGRVSVENRVKLATPYLEGKAIQWHQGYVQVKGREAYFSWEEYLMASTARFGAQASLQEYLDAFDELYAKARIPEGNASSFFLSGLSDELQIAIRMFKPTTLAEAYSLARLQELHVAAIWQKPKTPVKSYHKHLLNPIPTDQTYKQYLS